MSNEHGAQRFCRQHFTDTLLLPLPTTLSVSSQIAWVFLPLPSLSHHLLGIALPIPHRDTPASPPAPPIGLGREIPLGRGSHVRPRRPAQESTQGGADVTHADTYPSRWFVVVC